MAATVKRSNPLVAMCVLAAVSWFAYITIAVCSQSLHEEGTGKHSLLTLLALFGVAFVCYAMAIRIAAASPQDGRLMVVIIGAAVLFRATLLFSNPIEEIDLYRYLWDGAVVNEGVSPFRYSPQQVMAASRGQQLPDDLARLVALRDRSPAMMTILRNVHYAELPTIYPPVSQAIFALSSCVTPANASVAARMVVMKAWFVGFDLATLLLVIRLLRLSGRPVGGSVVYAWCPLLIKEIANSGHLDALAFFLTTSSLTIALSVLFRPLAPRKHRWTPELSALTLALAAGAKIYPVILAPFLFFSFARKLGIKRTIVPAVLFVAATAGLLWPMRPSESAAPRQFATYDPAQVAAGGVLPPLPPIDVATDVHDPSQSVRAFLGEWEMNDFLFLIVMENLRPAAGLTKADVPWFSVVPAAWRGNLIAFGQRLFTKEPQGVAFLLTRALLSTIFLLVALWFAWRATRLSEAADWLALGFLTMAWFWLLLPTLNPWYWTWTLPLLPFAHNRAWLALSGLVLLYYLRFWLTFHFAATPVFGTGLPGALFFDYVVTWLEFGPWFICLAWVATRGEHRSISMGWSLPGRTEA